MKQPKILDELGLTPIWIKRSQAQSPSETFAISEADEQAQPLSPLLSEAFIEASDDRAIHSVQPVISEGEAPIPMPVTELDWGALKERVSRCTHCSLCETRTQTVFGVGDEQADWMLIGEAPGAHEDRQGEPFVGQAGKLLDNMLHAVGRARGQGVYIANVIKCRPPGNRDPHPDEIAKCEPYLQRQIALIRPKLIIALGRFAAQSLLKTQASIASMRSRVHQYEGVPVIITYHPAYLLRNLPDKAKAWADLCFAQQTYREIIS